MEVQEVKSTKLLLKANAERLFRENGYPATSMRQLAASIDIEPASIYSHFKSKEEILKTIVFEMVGFFFKRIEKLRIIQTTPDEKLKSFIHAHIEVIANNINASAVFFHDWRHLSEENLAQFKLLRIKYESYFNDVLNEGINAGIFRSVDTKFTMLTLFSAMNWTYEWYKPDGKLNSEQIADNVSDIILNGLIKKK